MNQVQMKVWTGVGNETATVDIWCNNETVRRLCYYPIESAYRIGEIHVKKTPFYRFTQHSTRLYRGKREYPVCEFAA